MWKVVNYVTFSTTWALMKTKRIALFEWEINSAQDNIDIDWPKLHRAVGEELVQWILDQPITKCQLVVDKVRDKHKLVAEFYDPKVLTAYHLMWAK